MKSLSEWEEDWMAMFKLHQAELTPVMDEEWEQEKAHILKFYDNPDVSLTCVEVCTPKFELHIGVHAKWLKNATIDMADPCNLNYLSNLTHRDDRIFSLETEIIGYEILMSLSPLKRKTFWMKYHRRFMDKNGEYYFYVLHFKVHKFDKNGNPVFIIVETRRLPKKYLPDKIHYREFSHSLNQQSKQEKTVVKRLSSRELEVLELANEGFTTQEIALKLKLSVNTVKAFRNRILKKLNVKNMHMSYVVAHKMGMI